MLLIWQMLGKHVNIAFVIEYLYSTTFNRRHIVWRFILSFRLLRLHILCRDFLRLKGFPANSFLQGNMVNSFPDFQRAYAPVMCWRGFESWRSVGNLQAAGKRGCSAFCSTLFSLFISSQLTKNAAVTNLSGYKGRDHQFPCRVICWSGETNKMC